MRQSHEEKNVRKPRAYAVRNRERVLEAAKAVFSAGGPEASLEAVARAAGVGIGTLYRHFHTRTDLQAGVFRSQVDAVCATADELIGAVSPEQAFAGSVRAIAGYLITKRGLARALMDSLGKDSELISACSLRMRDTLERLAAHAQEAGVLRPDVTAHDVLRLTHGIVMATETAPQDTDRLLGMMLDGLRAGSVRSPAAGSRTGYSGRLWYAWRRLPRSGSPAAGPRAPREMPPGPSVCSSRLPRRCDRPRSPIR